MLDYITSYLDMQRHARAGRQRVLGDGLHPGGLWRSLCRGDGDELAGAQGAGPLADPPRPHARRPARPAAAHRRRAEAADQGRHRSGEADKFVFWIAPLIILCASFTVYIVIPFGPTHAITDLNIGILFMLGVSSLSVLGVVMAGWASNSHYPLIGALRSSAQMVSYEVAMGMAVVSAVLMTSLHGLGPYGVGGNVGTGTLSMIGIVQAQQAQHTWFLFKFFPLGFIAFGVFAIAMVAETNRAPFDLPEAESELTAGFHTEYSGLRWSLFMLGEYAAMIAVSSIAVTLWLGGWMRPFPNSLTR